MGTTKKLVVLCLALLMGIMAIMPSTFSWYDHSGSQTGDRMSYEKEDLPVSAGTLSMTTKKYRMANDNDVYYDIKGNKEFTDTVTSGSVASSHSQYYGTTITNTADSPAYVNLYLASFNNKNGFYVGTMEPSLRDKGVSPSVHLKNKNSIRVYFQWGSANNWNANGAKTYVVYTTKSGTTGYKQMTSHITAGSSGSALRSKQEQILGSHITDTYYADLADNTTSFFFATDANASGFNTSTKTTTAKWYRTNTITNVQSERGYYLTGYADDTTFHAQYNTFSVPGGISVMKYFDKAEINQNQKTYVSLTKGIHYTGSSASYSLRSGSGLTVNSGSGLVNRTGTSPANIQTTITGSLGDTYSYSNDTTFQTTVTTPGTIAAMPLAMNIKIPPNESTLVVWYIRNGNGSEACTFSSIYYTK
jgi:hypothetical protein